MTKQKDEEQKEFDVNVSPVGWYSTAILLRFEVEGEDIENSNRRCVAWENCHIIKQDFFIKNSLNVA